MLVERKSAYDVLSKKRTPPSFLGKVTRFRNDAEFPQHAGFYDNDVSYVRFDSLLCEATDNRWKIRYVFSSSSSLFFSLLFLFLSICTVCNCS